MLRTMMLLAVCATVATAYGQASATDAVPKWRIGDKRHVVVERETTTRIDTATTVTKEQRVFDLEVNRGNKNGYELWVRSTKARLPKLSVDHGKVEAARLKELDGMMHTLVAAMYRPLEEWNVAYELDPKGAVIRRVEGKKDKERLTDAMRASLTEGFEELPGGRVPLEIPTETLADVVDSLYEDFLVDQRYEMNRFIGVYGLKFPASGSRRESITFEGVELPFMVGKVSVPGMLEVGLDRNSDKEMTCRIVSTYDPGLVYQLLKGAGAPDALQRDGLIMRDETVLEFEKRTGWVTAIQTSSRLSDGAVQVNTTERVKLTATR